MLKCVFFLSKLHTLAADTKAVITSLIKKNVFCSVLVVNVVYFIFPKKKTQLHGFKWRGQRREEEMNKGQMVSSTGLCPTLQRKNPAEVNKHNNLNFQLF